jgi:hypothetical protein
MRLVLVVCAVFFTLICCCPQEEARFEVGDTLVVTAETVPPPISQPDAAAVFCARGPEVLRNLARLLTVAVQLWRS